MVTRIITGVVLAAVVFATLSASQAAYFAAAVTLAALLAIYELHRITEKLGASLFPLIAGFFTLVLLYLGTASRFELSGVVLLGCMVVTLARAVIGKREHRQELLAAFFTIGAVIYVGLLAAAAIAVRATSGPYQNTGARLVGLMIVVIVASDTGAYFTGITIGRHKLAPRISPAKTVEGSIGGLALALVCAWLYKRWFLPQTPLSEMLLLAATLVVAGTIGDLAESLLKRAAAVKDSSSLVPGHGGVLDRLDSMLLASAVMYCYVRFVFV